MNKSLAAAVLILFAAVLIGVYWYYGGVNVSQGPAATAPAASVISPTDFNTVEIIDNEFRPSVIKIKKGSSITWVNKLSVQSWPASAVHPSHLIYPEPGGCIASKFDACRGLRTGESWTFIFNQVGAWQYHDHLNAAVVKPGVVEVTE